MIQSKLYKGIELFILFILIPIMLTLLIYPIIKLIIIVLGFLYVLFILIRIEKEKFRIQPHLNWNYFWKRTFAKFLTLVVLSIIYVFLVKKEHLFHIVLNKPKLWLQFVFVYAILSVYPQELIYRTFFLKRYSGLIHSKALLIFINAVLFSLAHLFFRNSLVLAMTFLGGIIFALTFKKTQSTLLVSIEHAIYGSWLFTVGMGGMLGFPQ